MSAKGGSNVSKLQRRGAAERPAGASRGDWLRVSAGCWVRGWPGDLVDFVFCVYQGKSQWRERGFFS